MPWVQHIEPDESKSLMVPVDLTLLLSIFAWLQSEFTHVSLYKMTALRLLWMIKIALTLILPLTTIMFRLCLTVCPTRKRNSQPVISLYWLLIVKLHGYVLNSKIPNQFQPYVIVFKSLMSTMLIKLDPSI